MLRGRSDKFRVLAGPVLGAIWLQNYLFGSGKIQLATKFFDFTFIFLKCHKNKK